MAPSRSPGGVLPGTSSDGHQAARVRVTARAEHGRRGASLDDFAGIHHGHAVGDARDNAEIVRDEQERDAELALQVDQEPQDLRLDGDVERGRRLVGDQQRRAAHQRHGDHHALAQPAGQLVRILAQPVGRARDADPLEQLDRARPRGGARGAEVAAVNLHELVADRVGGIERRHRLLEHHHHAIAAQAGELLARGGREVFALEREAAHAAFGGGRKQAHQRERSHRLAAAGFADEPERLAGFDVERHVAHRMQRAARRRDVDREPVDLEQRHVRLPAARRRRGCRRRPC